MFTEIQSRQLYVVTSTGADVIAPTKIVTGTSGTYPTDLSTKSAGACQLVIGPNGDEMWFNYKGPSDDGVQRTDIIKKGNIISATATAAADLRHTLKRVELVVASSLLTSTNINTTEDYVLNVTIKGYIANGNDSKLFKYAVAHGVSGSAVSDLYKKLAISLAKNFAREEVPLVKIMLKNASTPVEEFDVQSELIPMWNIAENIKGEEPTLLVTYRIRYVKRPDPIVLAPLPNGLTVDGFSNVSECTLNPIIHNDILNRAVELALSTRARVAPRTANE